MVRHLEFIGSTNLFALNIWREMSGAIERKQKISNIFNVVGSIIFVLSFLTAFGLFPHAEGHLLIKRESEDKIAPKECERKIKETEAKDVDCFEIDSNVKCEEHCNELGEHKCGGTKGKAYNFQCKNPQRGDKKACCCAFKCESKAETKRRLEELYAKMKEDNRGMYGHWPVSVPRFVNFFFRFRRHLLFLGNFFTENFGRAEDLNSRFIF